MKINQEKITPGKINLLISISPDKYEKYLRDTALELSKKIDISGFRKGKVPYKILKNKLGEMRLLSESIDKIIRSTYIKAVKEQDLRVAMPPKIDVKKMVPGNRIEYQAEVVLLPEIILPDFSKIKIKNKKVSVGKKQINASLKELANMRAMEKIKKGPAEKGDKVKLDIKSKIQGQSADLSKEQIIILGKTRLIKGMEKQIIGLKAGEEKSFTQNFDANYHNPKYAGKEAKITIKINQVWERKLPKIDDKFAQGLNVKKFKNLAQLRKELKKNLLKEQEETAERKIMQKVIDQVLAKAKFKAIAPELLADVQQKMLENLKARTEKQGLKWTNYLSKADQTEKELKKSFRKEAKNQIKLDALMAEIIKTQKLKVDSKTVDKEVSNFLSRFGSVAQAKSQIDLERLRISLEGRLLTRKAIDYLTKQVKII